MDNDYRLEIHPEIGDLIINVIAHSNPGVGVHIILMAFPVTHPDGPDTNHIGTPTFLSSMHPDDMKQVLIEIGTNYMPNSSEPNITGVRRYENDKD